MREVIRCENVDCELIWGRSGWDVCLADTEFQWAKEELEGMKSAGGYVSTMKVFEGAAAAKVYCLFAIEVDSRLPGLSIAAELS